MGADPHGRPVPLARLSAAVRDWRLPSLKSLGYLFDSAANYQEFVRLVDRFLPDSRREVLRHRSEEERCGAFCRLFSEIHFPIHDAEEYGGLLSFCSVHTEGLDYDDMHEPGDFRVGYRLMWAVTTHPFEMDQEQEGIRVVLLDTLETDVPGIEDVLAKLPLGGVAPGTLWQMLEGTFFEPFALAAAAWHHQTGNPFLDTAEEEGYEPTEWDEVAEGFEDISAHWRDARRHLHAVHQMVEWLETGPIGRFDQAVDFIVAQLAEKGVRYEREHVRAGAPEQAGHLPWGLRAPDGSAAGWGDGDAGGSEPARDPLPGQLPLALGFPLSDQEGEASQADVQAPLGRAGGDPAGPAPVAAAGAA